MDAKERDSELVQGLEVFLEATMSDFPKGYYAHYQLESYNFAEETPTAPASDMKVLYSIEADCLEHAGRLTALKHAHGEDPEVWIGKKVFMTSAGLARVHANFLQGLSDSFGYRYTTKCDDDLYTALRDLTLGAVSEDEVDMFDDEEPLDYLEDKLNAVESERIQRCFRAFSVGDPYAFNLYVSAKALSAERSGVHVVCEIEDQHQQDFLNQVLFIPAQPINGAG